MNYEVIINKIRNRMLRELRNQFSDAAAKKRLDDIGKAGDSLQCASNEAGMRITVSLTSYGSRLASVNLAIESVMDQTLVPSRVVLYLDDETAPRSLPASLDVLQERGLVIKRGVPNLRGHKKYYWALQEYQNDYIVTIDDDIIYPRDMIERLLLTAHRNPGYVIARRVHHVLSDGRSRLLPYCNWLYEYRGPRSRSGRNFLTGCGGTLFPPQLFPRAGFDIDAIRSCALSADDVWLNCALKSADVPIYRAPVGLFPFWEIEESQGEALNRENVAGGGNDRAMSLTMGHFDLTAHDFED